MGVGRRDAYESGKQEPKCCKEGHWLSSLGGEYSLGHAVVQARVIRVLVPRTEGLEYENPGLIITCHIYDLSCDATPHN